MFWGIWPDLIQKKARKLNGKIQKGNYRNGGEDA